MIPARYIQQSALFLCLFVSSLLKMDIATVVYSTANSNKIDKSYEGKIWDIRMLSAFLWGYFLLQIPAGILSRRYGAKLMLSIAVITSSLMSLFIPIVSVHAIWFLFVLRFLQGLFQGLIVPSIYTHISRWTPQKSRSQTVAFVLSGTELGNFTSLILSEWLPETSFGWASTFYVSGICGIIWTGIWTLIAIDTPSHDRSITLEELKTVGEAEDKAMIKTKNNDQGKFWRSVLASKSFWALHVVHICHNWGYATLLALTPMFINSVFKLDRKRTGIFMAGTQLISLIMALLTCRASYLLETSGHLSTKISSKFWNTLGHLGAAMVIICITLTDWKHEGSLFFFTILWGLLSSVYSGFYTNHHDLSCNYSGVLMGITGTSANLITLFTPLNSSVFIAQSTGCADAWSFVFRTISTSFLIGNSVFVFFGSTETQLWNNS